MKKWAIVLTVLVASFCAPPAFAKVRKIWPVDIRTDLNGPRPRCVTLAQRWRHTLRHPDDRRKLWEVRNADGSEALVIQKIVFRDSELSVDKFTIKEINTASIKWDSLQSENLTDRIHFDAAMGEWTIYVQMSFPQYCFYPNVSRIHVSLENEDVVLEWNTKQTKLRLSRSN